MIQFGLTTLPICVATVNAYVDSPEMLLVDYDRHPAGKKPRFFVNPEMGFGK